MTTTKKSNPIALTFLIIFLALSLVFSFPMLNAKQAAYASVSTACQSITLTNSDFSSSSSNSLQPTPSGWSKQTDSNGKSGIINIKDSNFSSRYSSFGLLSTENPNKAYTTTTNPLDDYVLMINSKSSNTTDESNKQGYKSNNITFDAYSYYKVSVWAYTQGTAFGSIYLDGFNQNITQTKFEQFSNNEWTEYKFYVATGINSVTSNLQLWLGTQNLESYDAVYFDHITINEISANYYADEAIQTSKVNVINQSPSFESLISNQDFETTGSLGWTVIDYLPLNGNANVINIKTPADIQNLGFNEVGSDLTANNTYAFCLSSEEGAHFGYESQSFTIAPYQAYKISMNVKTSDFSGDASIVLKENEDVSNFYGEDYSSFYTPASASLSVTGGTADEMKNGYTTYTFYVRGHELYNTSLKLQLWFGSEEAQNTKGAVIFDNLTFEKVSSEQMGTANDSDVQVLTLSSLSDIVPTFTNGAFNNVSSIDAQVKYPLAPSNWEHSADDTTKSVYGVINTNSAIYEANKSNYGNIVNPGNPSGTATSIENDVNNVLMLWNKTQTYQTILSDTFKASANTYQRLTFDFKTVEQEVSNNLLNIYVLDSDNNVIYSEENLNSSLWTKYTVLIKTNNHEASLKLKISLGNEDNKISGYAYIDNIRFETDTTMDETKYANYASSNKTIDFEVGGFNLISSEQTNNMYTPYRYTGSLEEGTNPSTGNPIACGGIIDGNNNIFGITNSQDNTNSLKYMPMIRVNGLATYSLTGKDDFTLTEGQFYKFTISVLTNFSGDLEQEGIEETEKAKFGAAFQLSGLTTYFSQLNTDGEWKTYTLYVNANQSKTVNLKFTLTSESNDITGFAYFDNFNFETIEETEYLNNEATQENNDLVLAFKTSDAIDDTNTDTDDTTKDDNNSDILNTLMYIIPSLILAASLILALVAYYMKKIKIKKWERKKISEYDRDKTIHRDVIRLEAEKQRDEEVSKAKQEIAEVEKEIARIEEINKQRLKDEKSKSTITKQTEREFKAYAQRRTRLVNAVESIKAKIENMNSPEYLLSIQRKLVIAKVKQEKELKAKQK